LDRALRRPGDRCGHAALHRDRAAYSIVIGYRVRGAAGD
jgi:hypothetical protein